MRKEEIIKLSIIITLVLAVIGITGCQTPVASSIEITSPESMEQLDGNGTYEIEWIWTGLDKEINLMLVGYNISEEEIGMMSIDSMIQASSGSYTWGPNFGADILPISQIGLGGLRLKQKSRTQKSGMLQAFSRFNGVLYCK